MSDYIHRFNDVGLDSLPYYVSTLNKYWPQAAPPVSVGNCTWYAFGRSYEIADPEHQYDKNIPLPLADAEDWYPNTTEWEKGTLPALGSIICFAEGPFSGAGHVAVVEQINDDQSIIVSESGWDAYYFKTETLYPENNYIPAAGYIFQGFIYNPYAGDHPVPPGPGNGFKWWMAKRIIELKKRGY